MAKERDELLDHAYDGIREYNNPLPKWWLWLFYGTILFAVFYIPWYWLGFALSGPEEYKQELAEARLLHPEAAAPAAPPDHSEAQHNAPATGKAALAPKLDAQTLEAGKAVFAQNCVPCHGPQGQGVIGPNLTDEYWLHGDSYANIVRVITNGVPDKGMIAWRATLGPQKIEQVAAYVVSLGGTHPPNPKAPQGQLYKR
jgi:cytochrome c oxidase cbb3-type subunit 3